MKDFSKATPRPWMKGNDYSNSLYGKVILLGKTGTCAVAYGATIEEARGNAELIVTAVNNFESMKEALGECYMIMYGENSNDLNEAMRRAPKVGLSPFEEKFLKLLESIK